MPAWCWIPPTALGYPSYVGYFAADLRKDEAAVLAASQGPIFAHVLQDRIASAAWKSKPAYWALSTHYRIISTAFQRGEAARIKANFTTIAPEPTNLLSHTRDVAGVILDVVDQLRQAPAPA